MTRVAISIPAYNDALTLEALVRDSLAVLGRITEDHQVFIINDGSKDQTSEVLHKVIRQYPKVQIIEHPANYGFGRTIREVYTLPESDWIFFIPGDGQISPSEILKLYPHKDPYAFILGHRKNRSDPFTRRLNSWCYNMTISLLAGRRIRDVNSVGLIKREALNGIALKSDSAFIHAEILLEILRKKFPVAEIEITHQPRRHGKGSGNRWSVIFPTILDMLQYSLNRFFWLIFRKCHDSGRPAQQW